MILDSLLAGTILFTSFAMRTPNIQPNPDDYEFSLGFSNQFYHLNRQWERELGNNYIDDILWFKYESKFYLKPEYLDKQSKSVKYLKLDWRKTLKYVNFGFTTRSDDDNLKNYSTFFFFLFWQYLFLKIAQLNLKFLSAFSNILWNLSSCFCEEHRIKFW